jgi:hypothetical protein
MIRLWLFFSIIIFFGQLEVVAQCNVQGVYINAYLVDPNSGTNNFDTDGDGTAEHGDEFVQICNGNSSGSLSLASWTLGDNGSNSISLSGTLTHGECLTVVSNYNGTSPSYMLDADIGTVGNTNSAIWNNGGDDIVLSDGTNSCTVNYPSTSFPEQDGCATVIGTGSSGGVDCSLTPSDLGSSPLPVDLIEFNSKKLNDAVHLSWATASELNNNYFDVQKSANGIDFVSIAEVAGAGTTNEIQNYDYIDFEVWPMAYYRLKQVDFDGQFEYSSVIKTTSTEEQVSFTQSSTGIEISNSTEYESEFKLLTTSGQEILSGKLRERYNVDTQLLGSGMYLIAVYTNGQAHHYRFVK